MDETLGARLRVQRERQQIALATIAEQTKIKLSLLEGLERDDVSHWPDGIFRRAFVKAYAQAIGLEPDAVVREFLELNPDPVEVTEDAIAAAPGQGGGSEKRRPPMRLRYLVAAGVSAVRRSLQGGHARDLPPVGVKAADAQQAVDVLHSLAMREPALPVADLRTGAEHGNAAPSLGRALDAREVAPLLENAARTLDAVGLIVWSWEPRARALEPLVTHGYSDQVLAQFPCVRRDSDNAIAAAFRSAETHIVHSAGKATGAVVVPLMAPRGCVGVLALELRHGDEHRESVRAMAATMADQLTRLAGSAPIPEAVHA